LTRGQFKKKKLTRDNVLFKNINYLHTINKNNQNNQNLTKIKTSLNTKKNEVK